MSGRSTSFAFIAIDKFSHVADKIAKKADGFSGKFGKAGMLAAGGIGAVAAGLATAGPLMAKAIDDASDLSETLNKTNVTFGKSAGAIATWSKSAANDLGMTRQQALDAASQFALFGKTAGLTGNDLSKFSTDLVGMSADFASFHNSSPEETILALGAGLRGEAEPLRKFGILMDDASLKAVALDKGFIKATVNLDKVRSANKAVQAAMADYNKTVQQHGKDSDEAAVAAEYLAFKQTELGKALKGSTETLTPQAKALAAQALIMEQGKIASGDFKNTSDGLANSQRRLKATFSDISAQVGMVFLPIATKASNWLLNTAIPAFKRFGERVMPKIREVMDKVRQSIDDNRPSLDRLGQILKNVGEFVVTKLIPAWLKFEGFVLPLVVKAIAKVGEILPPIVAAYLTGAANVVNAFKWLYRGVSTVLTGILTTAERTMGWIPGIGSKIRDAKASFDRFRDGTTAALAKTETSLRTASGKVRDFGKNVDNLHSKNVTISATVRVGNVTITKAALAKLERMMGQGGGGMGGAGPTSDGPPGKSAGLMSATRGVGHPGARFRQWGPRWSWNNNGKVGQHDGADITGTGYGARIYAPRGGRFLGRLRAGYDYRGRKLWHGNAVQWSNRGAVLTYAHMSRFGGTMPGGIIGYVGSTGNSTGNHLHIQARRNGAYVNPAAYLASGGIVRRRPGGTVIVAGEGQHDEAVVPLDGRRMGGGDTYEIHVHGGFDQGAAREMQRALIDLQRRTGRPLFPAAS